MTSRACWSRSSGIEREEKKFVVGDRGKGEDNRKYGTEKKATDRGTDKGWVGEKMKGTGSNVAGIVEIMRGTGRERMMHINNTDRHQEIR